MVPDLLHINVMHKSKKKQKTDKKVDWGSEIVTLIVMVYIGHTRDETNTTTELGLVDRVCYFWMSKSAQMMKDYLNLQWWFMLLFSQTRVNFHIHAAAFFVLQ